MSVIARALADAGRRAAEGRVCRQSFAPEIERTTFQVSQEWRHHRISPPTGAPTLPFHRLTQHAGLFEHRVETTLRDRLDAHWLGVDGRDRCGLFVTASYGLSHDDQLHAQKIATTVPPVR